MINNENIKLCVCVRVSFCVLGLCACVCVSGIVCVIEAPLMMKIMLNNLQWTGGAPR